MKTLDELDALHAAATPGLDMCRDNARDVLDEALAALEAP